MLEAIEKLSLPLPKDIPIGAPFQIFHKKITCRHNFAFTLDFGEEPGPWIKIGINQQQFCLGFLPKGKSNKENQP